MIKIIGDYTDCLDIELGTSLQNDVEKQRNITIRTPTKKKYDFSLRIHVKIDDFERGQIDIGVSPGATVSIGKLKQVNLIIKHIAPHSSVSIGDGTSINQATFWCYKGDINIGCDNMFSEDIRFYSHDQHAIVDLGSEKVINADKHGVTTEDHVWIGRGAIVMPAVTIKKGSIIGASSLVTKNVPKNSIAAGNPAKVIRENVSWSRALDRIDTDFVNYKNESQD